MVVFLFKNVKKEEFSKLKICPLINGAKRGQKFKRGATYNKLKIFWNVIYHKSNKYTKIYYVDVKKNSPTISAP